MKNNISKVSNITWHDINKKGYINKSLKNQPAVYIYMYISSLDNKVYYYVGSSLELTKRLSSHRYLIINKEEYKNRGSPLFYKAVKKHGWLNFKFAVLEYVDLNHGLDPKQNRKTLLFKEQYYLDNINPSLNVCKMADSPLGVKRDITFSRNLSKSRRGLSYKSFIRVDDTLRINSTPKVVTSETRLLISSRCQGIRVKIFDKSNNLINEFPTITSAALYQGVHRKTISNIFKTGKSYDDLIYKFKVKDTRICIYDSNYKLLKTLDNIKQTSIWSNISKDTISDYIKSGKLYRNKFYFNKACAKSNIYDI